MDMTGVKSSQPIPMVLHCHVCGAPEYILEDLTPETLEAGAKSEMAWRKSRSS